MSCESGTPQACLLDMQRFRLRLVGPARGNMCVPGSHTKKHTPIIILTAMVDPKLNLKGFRAGADLALQKPFEPKKLMGTIKAALALKPKPPTP